MTNRSKVQEEIRAVQQIQCDQKNHHAEVLLGWNNVNIFSSQTRRAILAAKASGTLAMWEINNFVSAGRIPMFMPSYYDEFPPLMGAASMATGSGGEYGTSQPSGPLVPASGPQTPPITPKDYFIVINGEQIQIGGESKWPPGALDHFRSNLKKENPETFANVPESVKSLPGNGTLAKPPVLTAASSASMSVQSERAASAGEVLQNSPQEKSPLALLPKTPTGPTSSADMEHAASSSGQQSSGTTKQKTANEALQNSLQKKSAFSLLPKTPTGPTSSADMEPAASSSGQQSSGKPKQKTVGEALHTSTSQKKSVPPLPLNTSNGPGSNQTTPSGLVASSSSKQNSTVKQTKLVDSDWPTLTEGSTFKKKGSTSQKPLFSAATQPSSALKLVKSERAISLGETLPSTSQKKSTPPLLAKGPTVSTSEKTVSGGQTPSSSAKNPATTKPNPEKTVLRVRPNPPKEKTVDKDGFEVVSPRKSAPPKKAEALKKENASRPAATTPPSEQSASSSSSSAPPPSQLVEPTPSSSSSETKKKDKKKKKKTAEPEESEDDLLDRLMAENLAMKECVIAERRAKRAQKEASVEPSPVAVAEEVAPPVNPIPAQLQMAMIQHKIDRLEQKRPAGIRTFTLRTDTLEEAEAIRKGLGQFGGYNFSISRLPDTNPEETCAEVKETK